MVRKKAAVRNLNEEKENNNRRLEYTNNRTDVTAGIISRVFLRNCNFLTNLVCPITVGQKRPIELVDLNTIDNKEIKINKLKKQ